MTWQTPKTDWSPEDFYNFEDLNRVENNVEVLMELLTYFNVTLVLPTNRTRTMKTIELAPSLNRVENNIRLLGQRYRPKQWIEPKINWRYNMTFTYVDANRLEINLKIIYALYRGNYDSWARCGSYTCGEEAI